MAQPIDRKGPIQVTAHSKPWGTAMDGGPRETLVKGKNR